MIKKFGMASIRTRIVVFSILVTLVPSLGMGWFFYDLTYKAMAQKARQQLLESSGKVERDVGLWYMDREHDLQILAGSATLLEALKGKEAGLGGEKITGYCDMVRSRVDDYRRLAVFDEDGKEIAASDARPVPAPFALPADWKSQVATTKGFLGDISLADASQPLAVIGVPIIAEGGSQRLGVLAVQIRLNELAPLLQPIAADAAGGPWSAELIQKDGRPLVSLAFPEGQEETALSASQRLRLFHHPLQPIDFGHDKWVTGMAVPFRTLPWGLLVTVSYDYIYADVIHLRDRIILTVVLVTLLIGLSALVVARQIILPLDALTRGVLRVAEGDLDVTLDVRRSDELGIVSGMVNEMVALLRQNKQELEQLSVTDALTKLANRRRIMLDLNAQIEQYRRYHGEVSVLMVDIDHFKGINDTYGHVVGDAVLVHLAQLFCRMLRNMDNAGRWGGEEFLVILAQTDLANAVLTAERIRHAVENYPFLYQDVELHVTISVGVAAVRDREDSDNSLIGRAEGALSEAKATGRNRVVADKGPPHGDTTHQAPG